MHILTFWHTYTHTADARRAKAVTLIITLSQPKWGCEAELISTWTLCEGEKKSLIKSLQHFDSLTFFFSSFVLVWQNFFVTADCRAVIRRHSPPDLKPQSQTELIILFLKLTAIPRKPSTLFYHSQSCGSKTDACILERNRRRDVKSYFSWVFTFFMQMHSISHPNLSTNEKKTVASGWVDLSRPLKWHFSTLWCMIWLLSHIYDISLSWKSMGLNGEVVSDINHPSLSYLPLCVTLDVKRSTDSANGGYKREEKKKGIWVDCDKDNICTKRERSERRDGRR